jgi:hypothetical protein
MHHPPEVRWSVDGSPWPRRLFALVGLLAVLQVAWFTRAIGPLVWQTVVVGMGFLAATALAWQRSQSGPSGNLQWDGAQWQWSGFAGGTCVMQRHCDFQTVMLVSLQAPKSPPVWLWLQRAQDPYAWIALRRAIVHSTSPVQVRRAKGPAPAADTAAP